MSLKYGQQLLARRVPDPHVSVSGAADQQRPILRERDTPDGTCVSFKCREQTAGGAIPQPGRTIPATAGKDAAVRAERHAAHPAGMAAQCGERACRWELP